MRVAIPNHPADKLGAVSKRPDQQQARAWAVVRARSLNLRGQDMGRKSPPRQGGVSLYLPLSSARRMTKASPIIHVVDDGVVPRRHRRAADGKRLPVPPESAAQFAENSPANESAILLDVQMAGRRTPSCRHVSANWDASCRSSSSPGTRISRRRCRRSRPARRTSTKPVRRNKSAGDRAGSLVTKHANRMSKWRVAFASGSAPPQENTCSLCWVRQAAQATRL